MYVDIVISNVFNLNKHFFFLFLCVAHGCRTSQYREIFLPLSVSFWNDLADPVFDGVELAGFNSRANAFLLA